MFWKNISLKSKIPINYNSPIAIDTDSSTESEGDDVNVCHKKGKKYARSETVSSI